MSKDNISVIVITYNSEKWILETLESIKNQTYESIELIISDDCSTDLTISLCREWIQKNKKRFINVCIEISIKNEGVTKNINKGIKKSGGSWIKLIAGDDILMSNCIESNVRFLKKNPEYRIIFSKSVEFIDDLKSNNIIKKEREFSNFNKNAKKQYKILLNENFICAPTAFIKKELIEEMGYFDEEYPMVEDYPMWLKITENGIKLNFLDEETVYYRVHNDSISNTKDKILNLRMCEFRKEIYKKYISKKVNNPLFHYHEKLKYMRWNSIIKNGNKDKFTMLACLTYLIDPYLHLKILKKLLVRKKKL